VAGHLGYADFHAVIKFHGDKKLTQIPFWHFFVAADSFHNELIA